MDEFQSGTETFDCDVLVIGGGTAGPMAAYKAKRKNPEAKVVLLEKANVKRSGAISMGMDGLNNTVIPGHATPEQYTKEITIANDGIVNQKAVYKYAENCYEIIQELDSFGIRFQKDETGDYDVKKVHHMGTYVLPMPNGDTVKKALYRQLRRAQLLISNRYMATRLLTGRDGRIAGAIAVNTRNASLLVIRAKSVILCMGAAGRLGLPTPGYLFGTYENAANSGDSYAMAYHAGAELSNLECFQINPLIKDYNGPVCAYVAGPFGGYTANNEGMRFIESGGDNLAATFSPELADITIYVIDVSAGDKIPRKGGPGITRSDLLVINKIDLAPLVGADLGVMDRDSRKMRGERPLCFTNIKGGIGVGDVISFIETTGGLLSPSP